MIQTRQITFEEFVDLVGIPADEVDWLRERFTSVEVHDDLGMVTFRHVHPACNCKGTLHWRLTDYRFLVEEANIHFLKELIDEARTYYLNQHTKEADHG